MFRADTCSDKCCCTAGRKCSSVFVWAPSTCGTQDIVMEMSPAHNDNGLPGGQSMRSTRWQRCCWCQHRARQHRPCQAHRSCAAASRAPASGRARTRAAPRRPAPAAGRVRRRGDGPSSHRLLDRVQVRAVWRRILKQNTRRRDPFADSQTRCEL